MPPDHKPPQADISLRSHLTASDDLIVRRIVEATGFFRSDEVDIAVELVIEGLTRGSQSGYHFLFVEQQGTVVGYVCYGPIGCALGSYDIYWIAIDPAWQNKGLGRFLLEEVERRIEDVGGRHIYIETSGRERYAPTRSFYARCGYEITAVLPDFYEPGDDKVIWRKVCPPSS